MVNKWEKDRADYRNYKSSKSSKSPKTFGKENAYPRSGSIQLLRGIKDNFGDAFLIEESILSVIKKIYSTYGFHFMRPACIEHADILGDRTKDNLDGDAHELELHELEARKNSYQETFCFYDGKEYLGLRYDFTAPLVRYIGQNIHDLRACMPLKRACIGCVWRNEKPGFGRLREFIQADADIIGSASVMADTELCLMIIECFAALGFSSEFLRLNINHRAILEGVLLLAGVDIASGDEKAQERKNSVFRCIDKLDRIGLNGVESLLRDGRLDSSGDFTPGLSLDSSVAHPILDFLESVSSLEELFLFFGRAEKMHPNTCSVSVVRGAINGAHTLESILSSCCLYNQNSQHIISFNPTIVRGLDYYTGFIFEATLEKDVFNASGEKVHLGSCGGGGRYDTLLGQYTKNIDIPAVGCSIGVSRLVEYFIYTQKPGRFTKKENLVVILALDQSSDFYFSLAREIRSAGICCDICFREGSVRTQMKYADKKGACIAVLVGENERNKSMISIKDLRVGLACSESINERERWISERPGQYLIAQEKMVEFILSLLRNNTIDSV